MTAVQSRIAEIQSRFPVPRGDFRAALAHAERVQPPRNAATALPTANAEAGEWAAALPAAGQIEAAAHQAGVDPRLLASLVWAESGFRADARSHAGAIGLAQLMPGTAAGLGVDARDPAQNLLGGARYLRAQLDRFGSPELALAAYNAGPARVAQAGGVPRIAETQAYVPRVLGYFAQLGGVR
ncbi:MAG TPA: lytic transglycosylase domain-containing protein [Egibacteraceae bacterium]|nr:lytic transglycosylase domain-containing protein [Egibacteraceae bacterium]